MWHTIHYTINLDKMFTTTLEQSRIQPKTSTSCKVLYVCERHIHHPHNNYSSSVGATLRIPGGVQSTDTVHKVAKQTARKTMSGHDSPSAIILLNTRVQKSCKLQGISHVITSHYFYTTLCTTITCLHERYNTSRTAQQNYAVCYIAYIHF